MTKISYSGYRFPPEIIHQAIWLYLRFTLSFRDVEDLLAERGIAISYETIRRWVNHFGLIIAAELRKRRPKPHSIWHMDEVYLKIDGRMVYLWRAVDAEGEVLDVLVQSKRNKHAALKLMRKLLRKYAVAPERLVTDDLRSYRAATLDLGIDHLHDLGRAPVHHAGGEPIGDAKALVDLAQRQDAANVSAAAVRVALMVARASARRGLPRACPRAFRAARAAFVRSLIIWRSRSAMAAKRCKRNGSTSALSSATRKGTRCAMRPETKWTSRLSRSGLATATGQRGRAKLATISRIASCSVSCGTSWPSSRARPEIGKSVTELFDASPAHPSRWSGLLRYRCDSRSLSGAVSASPLNCRPEGAFRQGMRCPFAVKSVAAGRRECLACVTG